MNPELMTWLSEPLFIRPQWIANFNPSVMSPGVLARMTADDAPKAATSNRTAGGTVAVVSIRGPLTNREGAMTRWGGWVSYEWITSTVDSLVADPGVKAIVLDFESPGGSAMGVAEAADRIREAGKQKMIVAVSNGWCCSAAYFLASQAREVIVPASSQTGSIGCYSYHVDYSAQNEKFGVKVTYIYAGKYKVEMNADAPLDDEALRREQEVVDAYYTQFVDAVARGRGARSETVRNGFGEGRSLMGAEAVKERLADRIGTLEDVVAGLARRSAKSLSVARAIRRAELEAS